MTGTLISIISVFIGIITANLFGSIKKKYSFGFTGNTLAGVFGSIFFIKTFGRLGFDPWSIAAHGTFNSALFIIKGLVSALGAIIGLIAIKLLERKLNTEKHKK